MGAARIGKNLAVERSTLRRFLADPRRRAAHQDDQARSVRVALALGKVRREQHARRLVIPTHAPPTGIDFAGLPAGVELERQRLTIAFDTPRELLEKLVALAQALMNDYETFEAQLAPLETTA
jgi:hypothetical protein